MSKNKSPAFADLEYEMFRRLINEQFGLDYPAHKRDVLAHRIRRQMVRAKVESIADYYKLLRATSNMSSDVWRGFADAITNNETYFFRERHHFEHVASLLPAIRSRGDGTVRALSAGCSSGEEAYSMAMVIDTEDTRGRFEVCGVDISSTKINEAKAGRYKDRKFEADEAPPANVQFERYFERDAGDWLVKDELRSRVDFQRLNLADSGAMGALGGFDIVFCRNVLIYAHEQSFGRFVDSLRSVLRPGGYLFVGQCESLFGRTQALDSVRMGNQFVYTRAS